MIKFKIFLGSIDNQADVSMNSWLAKNPNVEIISFKYEQARYGDHSICIMYKEK